MTLSDVSLLIKKIAVGVILIIIPLLILFGGIKLSLKLLNPQQVNTSVNNNTNK